MMISFISINLLEGGLLVKCRDLAKRMQVCGPVVS